MRHLRTVGEWFAEGRLLYPSVMLLGPTGMLCVLVRTGKDRVAFYEVMTGRRMFKEPEFTLPKGEGIQHSQFIGKLKHDDAAPQTSGPNDWKVIGYTSSLWAWEVATEVLGGPAAPERKKVEGGENRRPKGGWTPREGRRRESRPERKPARTPLDGDKDQPF